MSINQSGEKGGDSTNNATKLPPKHPRTMKMDNSTTPETASELVSMWTIISEQKNNRNFASINFLGNDIQK